MDLDKSVRTERPGWDVDKLSQTQISYAALDALVSLGIHLLLHPTVSREAPDLSEGSKVLLVDSTGHHVCAIGSFLCSVDVDGVPFAKLAVRRQDVLYRAALVRLCGKTQRVCSKLCI